MSGETNPMADGDQIKEKVKIEDWLADFTFGISIFPRRHPEQGWATQEGERAWQDHFAQKYERGLGATAAHRVRAALRYLKQHTEALLVDELGVRGSSTNILLSSCPCLRKSTRRIPRQKVKLPTAQGKNPTAMSATFPTVCRASEHGGRQADCGLDNDLFHWSATVDSPSPRATEAECPPLCLVPGLRSKSQT